MLKIEIANLRMKNPLMNRAGVASYSGVALQTLAKAGAGAVITSPITKKPVTEYRHSVIIENIGNYLVSASPFNVGIESLGREIHIAKEGGVPVIGNVLGKSAKECKELL